MEEEKGFKFAVIPDIHLGRKKVNINPWDKEPLEKAIVGIGIERRLRKAVELINKDQEIKFTIVIGDVTDTALEEQFEKAREIIDKLNKPYIPLLGNHDVWPYRRSERDYKKVVWEAERPLTLLEFEEYFKESLKAPWLLKQTDLLKPKKLLQNYSFSHRGVEFTIIDNVNRRHALPGLPGTVPWSKLHKESKKWLERELSLTTKSRLIVFSHSPLKMRMLERLLRRSQAKKEMPLQRGKVKEIVNIAGHIHKVTGKRTKDGKITIITTGALYLEPMILFVTVSPKKIQFQYKNL